MRRATDKATAGAGRPMDGPVVYMTGCYPTASLTFIRREIAALRQLDVRIVTVSVRAPTADQLTGPEERAAATIATAVRTARPGLRGALWQALYPIEAAVFSGYLKENGVRDLHNHFAESSCMRAMLTSVLCGMPFRFTLHGPSDFIEPESWKLSKNIRGAHIVVCISHVARSAGMLSFDLVYSKSAYRENSIWDILGASGCRVMVAPGIRRVLRGRRRSSRVIVQGIGVRDPWGALDATYSRSRRRTASPRADGRIFAQEVPVTGHDDLVSVRRVTVGRHARRVTVA